jgi:hypothetical protein
VPGPASVDCESLCDSVTSLPLASGLKDGLKDKAKLNKGLVSQDDSDIMGGLSDDHASSVRPQFEKRKACAVNMVSILFRTWMHSTNVIDCLQVVKAISDSDESGDETTPVRGPVTKKAKGPAAAQRSEVSAIILPIDHLSH